MVAQMAISSENGEVQALSIGKSTMSYGGYLSDEEVRARIEAVTAEQVREVAVELFDPEKLSYLIYR